MSEKLNQFR